MLVSPFGSLQRMCIDRQIDRGGGVIGFQIWLFSAAISVWSMMWKKGKHHVDPSYTAAPGNVLRRDHLSLGIVMNLHADTGLVDWRVDTRQSKYKLAGSL